VIDVSVVAVTEQPEVVVQLAVVFVVIKFPLSSKIDVVIFVQSVTVAVVQDEDDWVVDEDDWSVVVDSSVYSGVPSFSIL